MADKTVRLDESVHAKLSKLGTVGSTYSEVIHSALDAYARQGGRSDKLCVNCGEHDKTAALYDVKTNENGIVSGWCPRCGCHREALAGAVAQPKVVVDEPVIVLETPKQRQDRLDKLASWHGPSKEVCVNCKTRLRDFDGVTGWCGLCHRPMEHLIGGTQA